MKKANRTICALAAAFLLAAASACGVSDSSPSTAAPAPAVTAPQPDAQLGGVLGGFYRNDLPSMALRTGIQSSDGQEIRCDYSMLQKSVVVDFDADGQNEIVLLYDVSELVGERNRDVIVFVDEQDGAPKIVSSETGSYGASKEDETYILSRYDSRVCKVRFIYQSAYEAVVVDVFEDGAWKTDVTAYHHLSDHDGVSLEEDSCYIDHAGGDLLEAVTGKVTYGKEKFLNFRTPVEHYNGFITGLLADTLLP